MSKLLAGEWAYIAYTFIPGIDELSTLGFVANTSFHVVVSLMAYIGNSGSDLLLMIFVLNLWPISQVFESKVEDLNGTLERAEHQRQQRKTGSAMVSQQLKDILKMHKDIYWYAPKCQI